MEKYAVIFGIGAMISLFFAYQQRKRVRLIFCKLCADVCWAIHYFMLSAYGGMIPNGVGILRELVFSCREKYTWANVPILPIVFILINWGLGIWTFQSPINILPIAASTLVTLSLWIKNPKMTKCISIPVSLSFLIYDIFVGSWIGVANEAFAIFSIILSLIKTNKEKTNMINNVLRADYPTTKQPILLKREWIENPQAVIETTVSPECIQKGDAFANEIEEKFVSDFEKSKALFEAGKVDEQDLMAHVSTFIVMQDTLFVSYYANTKEPSENPEYQTARLVYCPLNDLDNKTYLDIQTIGDECFGKKINRVYDTILMKKDEDTIFVMWTARIEENYYRFYRPFTVSTKTLGQVCVHRFKVGDIVNDFSATGIRSALTENQIGYQEMYADIGIMQKLSSRVENGETYYYTGAYSGAFACIIKSKDLITWEYVSQPDFPNRTEWENTTYVLGDKCYYFVRQFWDTPYGYLTVYDLKNKTWETPVLIGDCQSRGDFIFYQGELYLFHAPIDREHIGIVKIDRENIANSQVVLQAKMHSSCFYPFVQYFEHGELAMSYMVARQHIRLAKFTLNKYLGG